jgi:hypothetical protein
MTEVDEGSKKMYPITSLYCVVLWGQVSLVGKNENHKMQGLVDLVPSYQGVCDFASRRSSQNLLFFIQRIMHAMLVVSNKKVHTFFVILTI